MRRIAVINQKGGVGKTTTCANLGAALARSGRRVLVVDLDPQANLSMHLGQELYSQEPSTYTVLLGHTPLEAAIRPTHVPGLSIVPAHIDLSGAELELASTIGRETLLRDALDDWERAARERPGSAPADYVILDCPPSLGLLSVNGLAAVREVLIAVQTEFFALQGMSKLVEVVQLLRRRLNPELRIRGILPCLYDSRLRLAREVLAEVRRYFPGQVFRTSIRTNVKLAEAPSHGLTIFEYDPLSSGAADHLALAKELLDQEGSPPAAGAGDEGLGANAGALEERLAALAKGSRRQPEMRLEPVPPPAAKPPADTPAPLPLSGELLATSGLPSGTREPDPPEREADTSTIDITMGPTHGPDGDIRVPNGQYSGAKGGCAAIEDVSQQSVGCTDPIRHPLVSVDPLVASISSSASGEAEEPETPQGGDDPRCRELDSTLAPIPDQFDGRQMPPTAGQDPVPGDPERAPLPDREGAPREDEPIRVLTPRPTNLSRWNFGGFYGEDRVHMAGRLGPRVP